MAAPTFDVAIVGFGPTGAVAAGLLGQMGLSTFVCDRTHDVYDKPRAISLDHEVMRTFQQLGVVRDIEPHVEAFTPSEYFGVDGQLIRRMTMLEPPHPQGYTPSLVFNQPAVERVLRARAAAFRRVEIALGAELVSLAQDDRCVTLRLRGRGGAALTQRARYVVACDGAGSTVRSLVGIDLDDLDFDQRWLVADVRVNERGLAKLPKTSVQYCDPQRPCTLVIGPGNHRRWEISLGADEDAQLAATPAGTWALLSRWLTPDDGDLWRQASYRFHALVARPWRAGRVFVAGDAAHQQPPFLGQGMCQGLRDIANLAWKLRSAIRGDVRDARAQALLDSYGEERACHVRELTSRIKHVGALVGERDLAKARERDARLLAECGGVVKDTPRQDILPALQSGCLSARATRARGTLFPQPWLATDAGAQRMDAQVGYGWRLVCDDALAGAANSIDGVTPIHVGAHGLRETEGVVAAWMSRHACHGALLRPDHYVFGSAATRAELDQLLAERGAWLHGSHHTEAETSAP